MINNMSYGESSYQPFVWCTMRLHGSCTTTLLNAPRIASLAVVGGARYVNQQQRVIKKVSLVIARSALVENVSLSFPLSARERNSSIHADAINQRLSDF